MPGPFAPARMPSHAPAQATGTHWPTIAVILVTYRAADFIADCLESLIATNYPRLRVIVVDNASPDETVEAVERFAARTGTKRDAIAATEGDGTKRDGLSGTTVELHRAGGNLGFAAGVNVGLRAALGDRECDLFWVLNPDATVTPATPFALADEASRMGRFAVIGTRVLYAERPDVVQTDGGRLHALACTGVGVNIGARAAETPLPDPASLAYIAGVSMLVSREFVETAGLMPERWFLYYEEIDWQLARGDLPLGIAPQALVLHSAGASIGSGGVHKRASPLSVYFMARNLLPFVRRHAPAKLPFAYLMAYYKLVRQWGLDRANLAAMLRGLHRLGPPADVRRRLARDVWDRALSPPSVPSRPGDAAGHLRGRTNGDAD